MPEGVLISYFNEPDEVVQSCFVCGKNHHHDGSTLYGAQIVTEYAGSALWLVRMFRACKSHAEIDPRAPRKVIVIACEDHLGHLLGLKQAVAENGNTITAKLIREAMADEFQSVPNPSG